jgi:hypothetical protein
MKEEEKAIFPPGTARHSGQLFSFRLPRLPGAFGVLLKKDEGEQIIAR